MSRRRRGPAGVVPRPLRRRRDAARLLRRQLAGRPLQVDRAAARAVRRGGVGRPADPGLGRDLARPAAGDRRRARPGRPRCRPRPGGGRRLDDRAALQADAGRGRRPARADRDRARPRPVPDRPLRRGRRGRRVRADAALDRRGHHGGRHRGPGRRGRRAADRAGAGQPRRLPVGLARRRPGDHRARARRRGAGAVGPLPLGGRRADPAGRLGRRPRGRLHLQVPQRRARLAGLPLRRRPAPRRAHPADPGLARRRGPVPDGPVLRAGRPASGASSAARPRSSGCWRSRTCSRWSPRPGWTRSGRSRSA